MYVRKAAPVAVTAAQNAGRKRKVAVADQIDAFVRTRSRQLRHWTGADTDDVVDWLCWSDTQGGGTKAVHDADCPAVGTTTLERCPTESTCAKRCAAGPLEKGSLEKGFVYRVDDYDKRPRVGAAKIGRRPIGAAGENFEKHFEAFR